MKYAKFALAIAICLLCGLGVVALVRSGVPAVRKAACPYLGGRFASTANRCITRSCYAQHSCGHWSDAILRCKDLKAGDPVAEVYFQLGEPDGEDEGRTWWWASKLQEQKIVAVLEDGKLKALSCPTRSAFACAGARLSRRPRAAPAIPRPQEAG
jgi:hypothetical protein